MKRTYEEKVSMRQIIPSHAKPITINRPKEDIRK
jgi:hypothetical protein